jgi:hypothetical protein
MDKHFELTPFISSSLSQLEILALLARVFIDTGGQGSKLIIN